MRESIMTNTFGPSEWVAIAHDAIKDFKTARDQLPAGKRRDDLTRRIQEAEAKLSRADALLATQLGFFLCKCEFPGIPMLWREPEYAWVCPSCGHRRQKARPLQVSPSHRDRTAARRAARKDWDIFTGE
jgi:hypothetical protein